MLSTLAHRHCWCLDSPVAATSRTQPPRLGILYFEHALQGWQWPETEEGWGRIAVAGSCASIQLLILWMCS